MASTPETLPTRRRRRWWRALLFWVGFALFWLVVAIVRDTVFAPDPTVRTVPSVRGVQLPFLQPFSTVTASGEGNAVVEFSTPGDTPALLSATHSGSGAFAVVNPIAGSNRLPLLVSEAGDYEGSASINWIAGEEVDTLEITASGSWTIRATPLVMADRTFSGKASGRGDAVVLVDDVGLLTATHDGESVFGVVAYGNQRIVLINEMGSYDGAGMTLVPFDAAYLEIIADGNWTLDID
jgi:hypothetical protein